MLYAADREIRLGIWEIRNLHHAASHEQTSPPHRRPLDRITPAGRVLLRPVRREVSEIYREVVLGDGPDPDPHVPKRPRR